MWNFQDSWFLVLEFPRDITQFVEIFRDRVFQIAVEGGGIPLQWGQEEESEILLGEFF